MQARQTLSHYKNTLWLLLALLAHLLLFATFSIQLSPAQSAPEELEDKALPAYMYHDNTPPRPTPTTMPDTVEPTPPPDPQAGSEITIPDKIDPAAEDGILPAKKTVTPATEQHEGKTKSFRYKTPMGSINLKADKQVDKPLLRILSIATAAKLFYPKIAADFQVMGTTKIRFLLTPAGTVSDVSVVESSGAGVLDSAALQTIKAISPVAGVSAYLSEPQYLVVALIYG